MLHRLRRPLLAVVTALALGAGVLGAAPSASAATPGEAAVEAYAARLGPRLGAPTGVLGTVVKYGRPITYRQYENGFLAFNGSSVKLVSGGMLASYVAAGGVRGSLGAPVMAQWCDGAGCLQRFQKGSIYRSPSAPRPVTVSKVAGERSELLAVARSQVGYSEPAYRKSLYAKWVGGGKGYVHLPWCSFFVSWVSGASGNGAAIPKRASFTAFKKAVAQQKRTNRKAVVGKVALIDFFGDGRASHAGLVVEVRKNTIVTIEGNIDADGGSGHPRGVHQVVRAKKYVVGYANPKL
ncbi:MAG: CHAP domain-containing protein [Nocardioidaceae bacterium]|nr:CHAP domain-containing protein [Nocardioidaceae bacterium]